MKRAAKTPEKRTRDAVFEIFETGPHSFYWRIKRGGRILAESSDFYVRERAAKRAICNLTEAIRGDLFRIEGSTSSTRNGMPEASG